MTTTSLKNSSIIKGLAKPSPLLPEPIAMEEEEEDEEEEEEEEEEVEFSFPSVAADPDKLSDLPPPPFPSTPICFLPSPPTRQPQLHRNYQRSRSFSCLEDLKLRDELNSAEVDDDEEKMDMLWEDFNEELRPVSGDGGGAGGTDYGLSALEGKKREGSRDLLCVKAVRHQRRPGLLMILKVFKKLLSAQKSRKKRTPSSIYHM